MRKTEAEAENAGYEAGRYGANTTNCHFSNFATPELTKAWERGNTRGLEAKGNMSSFEHLV